MMPRNFGCRQANAEAHQLPGSPAPGLCLALTFHPRPTVGRPSAGRLWLLVLVGLLLACSYFLFWRLRLQKIRELLLYVSFIISGFPTRTPTRSSIVPKKLTATRVFSFLFFFFSLAQHGQLLAQLSLLSFQNSPVQLQKFTHPLPQISLCHSTSSSSFRIFPLASGNIPHTAVHRAR